MNVIVTKDEEAQDPIPIILFYLFSNPCLYLFYPYTKRFNLATTRIGIYACPQSSNRHLYQTIIRRPATQSPVLYPSDLCQPHWRALLWRGSSPTSSHFRRSVARREVTPLAAVAPLRPANGTGKGWTCQPVPPLGVSYFHGPVRRGQGTGPTHRVPSTACGFIIRKYSQNYF